MKKSINGFLWIVLFLVAYLAIQAVASLVGYTFTHRKELDVNTMLAVFGVSSVLTILLFTFCKWSPFSRTYLQSHPWSALFWVILLTMGTIIPSVWFEELIGADIMPEDQKDMLMKLMKEPEGYIVVGILVPVAEEMVFRGAILRKLLEIFHSGMYWWAIVLSALLFGVVHGNMAQGLHAFLLGLLLGWMYWRTNSIVPGIVLHWINNTVAFVLYNLIPGAEDARLVDIFGGDQRSVYLALAFSLCIFLPSLYQLTIRLKKEES